MPFIALDQLDASADIVAQLIPADRIRARVTTACEAGVFAAVLQLSSGKCNLASIRELGSAFQVFFFFFYRRKCTR